MLEFTDTYSIQALHTPGHTMESVVWMVIDKSEGNKPLHVSSCIDTVSVVHIHCCTYMYRHLPETLCSLVLVEDLT